MGPNLPVIAEAAFQEAKQRAGDWIVCRPGCDSCCRRPFAITEEDAARLRAVATPGIVARAEAAWARLQADFPGDASTGTLSDREDWREWFFARHQGLACPALDEETGSCLVHQHRPVACRLYGPLITIGGETSDPCPLCYLGATAAEIEQTRVTVELPPAPVTPGRETVIAWAFASRMLP
ncbi:MAG: YkgJ family cysteine cluster protein [Acidobacteria bacterium]|nr:YkgJ family cysteine cluster protein [Acidobacteriota bacterium]